MEQPVLPEIEPYVNRNLFSAHFLKELLPKDESWAVDEDKVRLAIQAALNLYAPRKEELPHLNEAQLEQEFVRPLLESLGHVFQVQPSLPTSEGVRRPDYAFFATSEDKRQARKQKGKLDYFKKAIAIGDAKHWDRPLDKKLKGPGDPFAMANPSWQIDYYLRMTECPWAMLTNGRLWRLYNRETSFRMDTYYQIDLPQIMAQRDLEAFKYFYLFFRRQAFVRDPEGLSFLDRVYQGSLEYAREVGDDLKESVYRALRILAEGFVETPGNNLDPGRHLEEIHASALIYLYRLLFINYAEDRRLLPRDKPVYKETYGLVSMEGEIASKLERQESLSPLQATYWEKLRVLFDLINQGSEAFGIDRNTLFIPPYNGGLFDPEHHRFLEENRVADRWLAQVMDLLARSKGEGVGRAFVDYSSLDVRHLGSIYEGLLEYKLRVADEEMAAISRRGREEWVSASEAAGKKAVEQVQPGQLYLATDRGERKATGSYYTPEYVVKYIVENTLGPLIAHKKKDEDPIEAILSLKVLDPAMGSGHFLVEATDRLAHALIEALGGSPDAEDDIRWARREVVERCIYGVDLNPLAVELAKLSLWLHTVAEGKPLNFLDHHLKVGNSLIGARVADLGSLPTRRKRVRLTDREEISARQMNLFEQKLDEKLPIMLAKVLEISRRPTETLDDIKSKEAADQAIKKLKVPFKGVADLWVSTYFGNEVEPADYDEALQLIGEPRQLLALPPAKRACEIAEDKRFFHWELEFPEVFYQDSKRREDAGFDAVVGNPPYVRVQRIEHDDADYLLSRYETCSRKIDLSVAFLELGTKYINQNGLAGFISSSQWLATDYGLAARGYMARGKIARIVDFGSLPVFEDISTYPAIFILTKAPEDVLLYGRVQDTSNLNLEALKQLVFTARDYAVIDDRAWIVEGLDLRSLLSRRVITSPLSEWGHFYIGALTGSDEVFVVSDQQIRELGLESELLYPYAYRGDEIERYSQTLPKEKCIYPYRPGDKGESILLSELDLRSSCPRIHAYLHSHKRHLTQRRDSRRYYAQGSDWFSFLRPGRFDYIRPAKLIIRGVATRSCVGILDQDTAFNGANCPGLILDGDQKERSYLLALLDSHLISKYLVQVCPAKLQGYTRFNANNLNGIPIRRIEFTTPREDRVQLVTQMQVLYDSGNHDVLLAVTDSCLSAEPEQADVIYDFLAHLADQMIEMHEEKRAEAKGFLDWLGVYTGLPINEWRLKTIIQEYWQHDWDEIRQALRDNRKPIEKASGRNMEGREALEAIQREFDQSAARLKPLLERIASTDRLIDLIVYRLYGLTEEEVAIVEGE